MKIRKNVYNTNFHMYISLNRRLKKIVFVFLVKLSFEIQNCCLKQQNCRAKCKLSWKNPGPTALIFSFFFTLSYMTKYASAFTRNNCRHILILIRIWCICIIKNFFTANLIQIRSSYQSACYIFLLLLPCHLSDIFLFVLCPKPDSSDPFFWCRKVVILMHYKIC